MRILELLPQAIASVYWISIFIARHRTIIPGLQTHVQGMYVKVLPSQSSAFTEYQPATRPEDGTSGLSFRDLCVLISESLGFLFSFDGGMTFAEYCDTHARVLYHMVSLTPPDARVRVTFVWGCESSPCGMHLSD